MILSRLPALITVAGLSLALTTIACDDKKKADPTPEKVEPKMEEAPVVKAEEPKKEEAPAVKAEETKKEEALAAAAAKKDMPAMAEKAEAQFIRFTIDHHDPAKGPVNGHFEDFTVSKANVDLANPSNAMAEIKIAIASIKTGIADRDEHVVSKDFFDAPTYATATLTVNELKPAGGDKYNATATLDMHGITKSFPVSFVVAEKRADGSIVVEAVYDGLTRSMFGIGAEPEKTNVADKVGKVNLRLVLANK